MSVELLGTEAAGAALFDGLDEPGAIELDPELSVALGAEIAEPGAGGLSVVLGAEVAEPAFSTVAGAVACVSG